MVTQFCDVVKEGCDHVILNSELRHLIICILATSVCYNILQYICNSFFLLLFVVDGFSREDSGSTIRMSTSQTVSKLRVRVRNRVDR